jgi:hypothetical protein
MPKIRLVKVVVQPVLMLDEDGELTEIEHPPVVIPAAEWPTYSSDRFPREIMEWQARLDADDPSIAGRDLRRTDSSAPTRAS